MRSIAICRVAKKYLWCYEKEKTVAENRSYIKIAMLSVIGLVITGIIGLFFLKPILMKKVLPKPVIIDTSHQPLLGNPHAKINIVAFEDLKCVNCARFNIKIMPYLQEHYIKTGEANYTMINLAFINGSLPVANAARCLYEQNKAFFYPFVDYVFQHQPPENENWATIPALLDFASHIEGVNTDQLAQCMIQSPYDQFFQNNMTQAMKLMTGNVATPSVYINGIAVTPVTKAQIQTVIEAVK